MRNEMRSSPKEEQPRPALYNFAMTERRKRGQGGVI